MTAALFSFLGGSGIASEVVTHNASGQEELFVRLASNNAIYSYNYGTGQFTNTGGNADQLIADDGGIVAIAGGGLYRYQDGATNYTYLGGSGVTQAVVTHDASGQEEVFARAGAANSIYYYNFTTGKYTNTGGSLDQIVPDDTGIVGIGQGTYGYLWHYQDTTGYLYTGGNGVTQTVVTHMTSGQEAIFCRVASGAIYYYSLTTHQFTNTGGTLDKMTANAYGITGTINGLLFDYTFGPNFYFTGGNDVTSFVVSHDPIGREEVFAAHADGTFYVYVYSANEWHSPTDKLDQFVADDDGITGTNGGSVAYLYHYQDATTDFAFVGTDYLLRPSYAGTFNDRYEHIPPPPLGDIMTGTTTGSITLNVQAASPTTLGYDIWGTITVTDSTGFYDFTLPFVGYYSTGVHYPSGFSTPGFLEIQNTGSYGSYMGGQYNFRFLFLLNSQGMLTASNNTTYNFGIDVTSGGSSTDDNNGAGGSGSNVSLSPTS